MVNVLREHCAQKQNHIRLADPIQLEWAIFAPSSRAPSRHRAPIELAVSLRYFNELLENHRVLYEDCAIDAEHGVLDLEANVRGGNVEDGSAGGS